MGHPVCSLSWSRSGRRVVSASTDNTVTLWDVLTGECDQKFRFPSPVLRVQFNPRSEREILVTPMRHAAVVVTLGATNISSTDKNNIKEEDIGDKSETKESSKDSSSATHHLVPLEDENDPQIVATYDQRGKHIYTGNSKGKILVVANVKDKEGEKDFKTVAYFKVLQASQSATAIKSIEFARRTKSFLVNTADRVIRVYKTTDVLRLKKGSPDPEPDQKLQDLVNKTMWKKCCFSGDGEYVCAGSARQHALYIWEKSMGNLVKILHGTKGEVLLDVVWHPVRPIVASISQGVVTVWAQQQVENWSAFAPDFKELDENVDYDERESEFDIEDEDRSVQLNEEEKADIADEIEVDKNVPIPAFCSSDEEGEDSSALLYLPIAPDIEEPEDGYVPEPDSGSSPKRDQENAGPSPAKKKRTKTTEIQLENAPQDEVHPLLHKTGTKERGASKKPQG